jgi:exodeoxyribonuclease V gamma subunit
MPYAQQNTWAYGLQRLILGYAAGQAEGNAAWQGVLPLPQVSGLSALKVGCLAQWLEAVSSSLTQLNATHAPAEWCSVMHDLMARFFEADNEADERMLLRLKQELTQWQSLCEQAGLTEPLPLTVVREHWLSGLESTGLKQRFFGGGVQFSTLMPMRAIPFKGLCLLGMNDGAYPRQSTPRDFDLMATHWLAGDRSPRRRPLLVLRSLFVSPRKTLHQLARPQVYRQSEDASVCLGRSIARYPQGPFLPELDAVLQPLQAFSAKYFKPDSKFFTYADDWEAAQSTRSEFKASFAVPTSSEAAPAQFPAISEWPLQECMRLLRQPVDVYWRSRLGVLLKGPEEAMLDDENFSLNGLDRYALGRQLLEAEDIELQLEAEKLLGQLPMGASGQLALKQQYDAALRVIDRADAYLEKYPQELPTQSVSVVIAMPWGEVRISAEILGLRQAQRSADQLPTDSEPIQTLQLTTRPGAVATGQKDQQSARADVLVNLWPNHVLLSAAGWTVSSVAVGLDAVAVLPAMPPQAAKHLLAQWLAVYAQAWAKPLPTTLKAGLAFVSEQIRSAQSGKDVAADQITEIALDKARKEFFDGFSESTDWARSLYVQRSFDNFDPLIEGLPNWAPLLYSDLIHAASIEGGAS